MPRQARHFYLVTLGLSQYHGSELSVGWQWYCRLAEIGQVTVLTHSIFKDERFLDVNAQTNCLFFGKKPARENDFNRFHPFYAYAFWFACRRYLHRSLKPADRVFIVTPAALWFLPLLGRLSYKRDSFYYGPLGGDLLPVELLTGFTERVQAKKRNVITRILIVLWRLFKAQLPARVSFRTPSTEKIFPTSTFRAVGIVPEVEISAHLPMVPSTRAATPEAAETFLVSLDGRLRKNTPRNLAVASALARQTEQGARRVQQNAQIIVLGSKALAKRYQKSCAGIDRHIFRELQPRSDFLAFLNERQPSVVALSLSEGVPGYLLEALCAGCWVLTYPLGGIIWLVDCAAEVIPAPKVAGLSVPGSALWIRWDTGSQLAYQRKTRAGLRKLMDRDKP
jgi:glycosyltransferase involved in cell wall biosynthesis